MRGNQALAIFTQPSARFRVPVRAAFLLASDLAVLILRNRLAEVLGIDPLSAAGMRRWGAEVLAIYRDGLAASPPGQP
jgi:TetR/AcrR family transcriptional regulator, regulator of cefoperazone and chloramphenicol sensitivity